jgi:hypothetical protein
MGPLTVPDVSRKRRWGWLTLWTLLVFAGGVAAGPTLTNQALSLVERGYAMLGMSVPQFVGKSKPAAPSLAPAAPSIAPLPEPAPGVQGRAEEPAAAAEPVAARAAKPAEPERPAAAVAPPPAARTETAAAPGRAEAAAAKTPAAHPAHAKNEARTSAAKAAPTVATAAGPAASTYHDPFTEGDERANGPKSAVPARKSRPSFEEPAPKEKSEPATRPTASGSQDSLDNLMADVVTDKKKEKRHEGKSLDALLNDVQKSKPEPAPKREEPAPLPPLSQADISRVMAGVKMRGQECGRQLGQKGIAELKLVVSKDGRITGASVGGKLANTPVGACIEKAVRAASFPPSAGLRFEYRIDIR